MNNNTTEFKDLVDFVNSSSMANKLKKKRQKRIVLFASNLIAISCLIGGGFGIKTILDNKKDMEEALIQQEEIKNFVNDTKVVDNSYSTTDIQNADYSLENYINSNSDTVGYLVVPGTSIDTVVVQSNDNDYYLNHSFNKSLNSMGWTFADYRNTFPNFSKNTIIYSHTCHNCSDKSIMFTSLRNVLSDEWLNNEDNYIISFNSANHEYKWKVFSIYTIPTTVDYLTVDFTNGEFLEFNKMITDRSIKDFNVDIDENDKILTLSTCYVADGEKFVVHANKRLVVHAKLLK